MPTKHKPIPKIPERRYYHSNTVDNLNNQAYGGNEVLTPLAAIHPYANLVSSYIEDQEHPVGHSYSIHAPVIDFDFPIEVLPSTQLGHYHLYIHKPIPWFKYKQILLALGSAELIEQGYKTASYQKGFTAVRPAGVVKPNPPRGANVLKENAKLRQENFQLKLRVQELEAQLNESKQVNAIQKTAEATVTTQESVIV